VDTSDDKNKVVSYNTILMCFFQKQNLFNVNLSGLKSN